MKNAKQFNASHSTSMQAIEASIISLTPSGLCEVIVNNCLASKIIAFANNVSFFSEIRNLAEAIIMLGFNTCKAFVIDELVISSA